MSSAYLTRYIDSISLGKQVYGSLLGEISARLYNSMEQWDTQASPSEKVVMVHDLVLLTLFENTSSVVYTTF